MKGKKKERAYGGLEKKYAKELLDVNENALTLSFMVRGLVLEMSRADSDLGDVISRWLNGPYSLLPKSEKAVADLEAKILSDEQFPEAQRRRLVEDALNPLKHWNQETRRIDASVMCGET